MDIIKFSREVLGLKLSPFQEDLLELLQVNPDGWYNSLKFNNLEMRQVREVYLKFNEMKISA